MPATTDYKNSFIGLDIGTSFIKGAILDVDHHSLHHIQRHPFPEPVANLPANFFEVDPNKLIPVVRSLLVSLRQQAPNCRGIVTSTQMHGLVLTDTDYQPLTNIITWRDQRAITPHPNGSGSYYDQLLTQITEQEQRELGGGLRAGLPIGTLYWMAQQGKLPEQTAIPLTLSEYLLVALCLETGCQETGISENIHPAIEPTNAAAYGTYNLTSGTWHWPVLEKLGLDGLQWPEIGSVKSVVGTLQLEGQSIPCYASVGDHQCALAGSVLQTGELSLNISTGSQASLITSDLVLGDYETRPYFGQRFLNTLVKIPAGRSLSLLVDLLTEIAQIQGIELADPWAAISQAVDGVSESDLEVDLSFYDSVEGQTGSITNIREDNLSVGHLFDAAFQRMAVNYLEGAQRLAGDQSIWSQIVFSGGLAQKVPSLRQAILSAFQKAGYPHQSRLCAEEEDTLLGLLEIINGEL